MQKCKEIIVNLLTLLGNETNLIEEEDIHIKMALLEVIANISAIQNNVRSCDNKTCYCQPEYLITLILEKDKKLVNFLEDYRKGIVEEIILLCEGYTQKK